MLLTRKRWYRLSNLALSAYPTKSRNSTHRIRPIYWHIVCVILIGPCHDKSLRRWHDKTRRTGWTSKNKAGRHSVRYQFRGGGGGGGWGLLPEYFYSFLSSKIKWFCQNSTCFFARKINGHLKSWGGGLQPPALSPYALPPRTPMQEESWVSGRPTGPDARIITTGENSLVWPWTFSVAKVWTLHYAAILSHLHVKPSRKSHENQFPRNWVNVAMSCKLWGLLYKYRP